MTDIGYHIAKLSLASLLSTASFATGNNDMRLAAMLFSPLLNPLFALVFEGSLQHAGMFVLSIVYVASISAIFSLALGKPNSEKEISRYRDDNAKRDKNFMIGILIGMLTAYYQGSSHSLDSVGLSIAVAALPPIAHVGASQFTEWSGLHTSFNSISGLFIGSSIIPVLRWIL